MPESRAQSNMASGFAHTLDTRSGFCTGGQSGGTATCAQREANQFRQRDFLVSSLVGNRVENFERAWQCIRKVIWVHRERSHLLRKCLRYERGSCVHRSALGG